jgi:cobalt/nickel transport protein
MHRLLIALLAVPAVVPSVWAHYSMLLPEKPSVKKGEEVTFTYQWGHPFEHQLFDAPKPADVYVLSPSGKKAGLMESLEKATVSAGEKKEAVVYRFRFKPQERGDYVFVLKTARIWMEEEKEYWQDRVRVVLHVQTQKGWDGTTGDDRMEMVPLTRPYGLQPGMVFQAQALGRWDFPVGSSKDRQGRGEMPLPNTPLAKTLVEIERYSPTPPKELPADEHITRAARTDPNGVVTCTLNEPGWWCIAAQRELGTQEREGKEYTMRGRAIHWVFVDEKQNEK